MSYLVILIVDNVDHCPPILDAWEEAGVTGVTILASTGLGHIRRAGLREDLPLMPSLEDLFEGDEVHHRTMLSVVDNQEIVDKMADIAQRVIGDLDDPNTGFLFVLPVLQVYGLGRHRTDRSKE